MNAITLKTTPRLAAAFVAITLTSCDRSDSAFEAAKENSTEASYQEFIDKYPNSIKAPEARVLLEELAFNRAVEEATESGFEQFLRNHPNSKHVDDITAKYSQILFASAKEKGTVAAYRHYLAKTPQGSNAPAARKAIQELNELAAWQACQKANTSKAYAEFIAKFPDSDRVTILDGEALGSIVIEMPASDRLFDMKMWFVLHKAGQGRGYYMTPDQAVASKLIPIEGGSLRYSTKEGYRYTDLNILIVRKEEEQDTPKLIVCSPPKITKVASSSIPTPPSKRTRIQPATLK